MLSSATCAFFFIKILVKETKTKPKASLGMKNVWSNFTELELVYVKIIYNYYILSPFHNVSHSSIFHIHIDVNESIININVGNVKMTYIVKRREYVPKEPNFSALFISKYMSQLFFSNVLVIENVHKYTFSF